MISVKNLVYEYPGNRVLHNISFDLAPESITALVGPNGAGKTTLMRCLAALIPAFSGEISIQNLNPETQPREIHKIVGYLADSCGLYDALTVEQCLTYAAWSHGIAPDKIQESIQRAAHQLQIETQWHKTPAILSRGLRQRLAIAAAIVHQPPFLILDEPASGLDPEARYHLAGVFLELNKTGTTILVSSHILTELEDYCTNMLVMKQGCIHAVQSSGPGTFKTAYLDIMGKN